MKSKNFVNNSSRDVENTENKEIIIQVKRNKNRKDDPFVGYFIIITIVVNNIIICIYHYHRRQVHAVFLWHKM